MIERRLIDRLDRPLALDLGIKGAARDYGLLLAKLCAISGVLVGVGALYLWLTNTNPNQRWPHNIVTGLIWMYFIWRFTRDSLKRHTPYLISDLWRRLSVSASKRDEKRRKADLSPSTNGPASPKRPKPPFSG